MALWPTEPEWTPPSSLNKGNEYTSQDGVTIADMNAIIKNLIYLNKYGGGGSSGIKEYTGESILANEAGTPGVVYKDTVIALLVPGQTVILECAGKLMGTNIAITVDKGARKMSSSVEVLQMTSTSIVAKIPKITTEIKGEVTT